MTLLDRVLSRGLVPDPILRVGIDRLVAARLNAEDPGSEEAREARIAALVDELASSPVALHTEAANRQHYEVPTAFFRLVLGPRLKYSSAYWPAGVESLATAEEAMLALTETRAGIENGQTILDLGCGWGSLTLWLAARFPASRIVAVSNSRPQRDHILATAAERGLRNVEAVTADVNAFRPDRRFDRIVSVEMLEHVRNYRVLLGRIAEWLTPEGRLFVHVFCHRRLAYPFESREATDWMARNFFTGGLMPSADLLPRFREHLAVEEQWFENGRHYAATAEAWLHNLDTHREAVLSLFADVYGPGEARSRYHGWRVFFLACAGLFGFAGGSEWGVAHYRFALR